jgi:hypothetical protein
MKLQKNPNWEKIDYNNFMPRGSILKYTDWAYGMVIYAGIDCKIFQK